MYKIEKQLTLRWKLSDSSYKAANVKVLVEDYRRIGASTTAVNAMISKGNEMKALMPSVIGLSSNSPDFEKRVTEYWNSISYDVPDSGKDWQIGYSYDFTTQDSDKKDSIRELVISAKAQHNVEIKSDVDLAKYCDKYIAEEYKYKYGTPINIADYLIWRYCLNYSHVANTIDDVNKSGKIRFYMFSEDEARKRNEAKHDMNIKAMQLYLEVIKDEALIDNILFILNRGSDVKNTLSTKTIILKTIYEANPAKFVEICGDANIKLKAAIEKLISANIIRRLTNTQIIVDSTDSAFVIGNTMEDAIAFFSNDANKQKVNEYYTKYKGLPK